MKMKNVLGWGFSILLLILLPIWIASHFAPAPGLEVKETSVSIGTIGALFAVLIPLLGAMIWITYKTDRALRKEKAAKAATATGGPTTATTVAGSPTTPAAPTGASSGTKPAAAAKPEKEGVLKKLAYSLGNYLVVTLFFGTLVMAIVFGNNLLRHGTLMPKENPFLTAKYAEEWRLTWTKPPGFRGKDPSVRSGTYAVKMLRDDELAMEFIQFFSHQGSTQTAKFVWDKKDARGIWYQEKPLNSGTWYLVPEKNQGGRTVRWTGVQTSEDAKINGQPVEIPMTLVLHLKPMD